MIAILTFNYQAEGQFVFSYNNFEKEIIDYTPTQKENVEDREYNYGLMILDEIKNGVKNDPDNFNLANYFNALSAFLTLKESDENIKLAFTKFKESDGSCEYIVSFENTILSNRKYDPIIIEYNKQLEICKSMANNEIEEFNISEYCRKHSLDENLVIAIVRISDADQKYRKDDTGNFKTKQKLIDKQNQKSIDSLFNIYDTYIGKGKVGSKFESVMWAVIQHSDVETMGKYLPVVHQAVVEGELDVVPLKMLIDRYYGLKYGYQVFGSQTGFGFEIADEDKKNVIIEKYGIEELTNTSH